MKKIIIFWIIIFSLNNAYSQKTDSINIFKTGTYTFAYFGNNLLNPGVKAGINFILKEKTTTKNKTKKNGKIAMKTTINQLLAGADIGFFWQPESHIGTFNFYELSYRKINRKDNSYRIFGVGPGIYRSFYPETFEVDNDGNIRKTNLGGRTYFAPVVTIGSGRFKKDSFLHSLAFSTNLMFLFNYNTGIVPLLNLEIDFCFDFKK